MALDFGLSMAVVMAGLLLLFGAALYVAHFRLPEPPMPPLARDEQVVYRVLLKHRRLYGVVLMLVIGACIVQAMLGARHVGWAQTLLLLGRAVGFACTIMVAGQGLVMLDDDRRAMHKPLDPAFDLLAPRTRRTLRRLILLKMLTRRLSGLLLILMIGVALRFSLSIGLGIVCYLIFIPLIVLSAISDIMSRRIWYVRQDAESASSRP